MAKCKLCDKKIKFTRQCPAVNEIICSTCCGSKKGVEIKCINDCKHFVENEIKDNKKQIMQLVKESFIEEYKDIYKDSRILELVAPFEMFIFKNYYNNMNLTDDFIMDCYIKMYYSFEEKGSVYTFNEIEEEIFEEFKKIADNTEMPTDSQRLILLRMIRSIDSVTGGVFGNRMYLELLRNNFTGTGLIADVMGI